MKVVGEMGYLMLITVRLIFGGAMWDCGEYCKTTPDIRAESEKASSEIKYSRTHGTLIMHQRTVTIIQCRVHMLQLK